MSRTKDMIIERESTIISLIRRLDCITEKMDDDTSSEIWDAWSEYGLPYDDEDEEILFDIVTDEDIYEYTIATAEKFLAELEKSS